MKVEFKLLYDRFYILFVYIVVTEKTRYGGSIYFHLPKIKFISFKTVRRLNER